MTAEIVAEVPVGLLTEISEPVTMISLPVKLEPPFMAKEVRLTKPLVEKVSVPPERVSPPSAALMLPSSRTPKPAFVNPPLKSEVILNVLNSSMVQVWAPLAISLAAPLIVAEFWTVMPLVPTVIV